ncbi:hypothetical protein [Novosphingobium guangzhouense]|uniref:Uncharacterized protein n=1 Tax=Novosphingobium guangzhouense TaxID=1850347 RepID=A0A2K2G438_9SPHN|nr:hypothetical protein [Novosphingobium guangzhouense]PNU05809.1 hypothetical protein A8V01_14685 [Novosphingobium guangzhouense]
MAFTAALTVKLGAGGKQDVAIGAGAAEAARDQMTLNIDATKMSKGEAMELVDKIRDAIFAADWPIN